MSTEIFKNPFFYNKGSAGGILLNHQRIISSYWLGVDKVPTPPKEPTGRQDGTWAKWTGDLQESMGLERDEHFGPATRTAVAHHLRHKLKLDDQIDPHLLSSPAVYKGDNDEFFHFSPPQSRWFQKVTLRDGPTLNEAAGGVTIIPKVIGRAMYLGGGNGDNRVRRGDWDYISRGVTGDEIVVLASYDREILRNGTQSWRGGVDSTSIRSVLLTAGQSPYDLVSMCEFWPDMILAFEG